MEVVDVWMFLPSAVLAPRDVRTEVFLPFFFLGSSQSRGANTRCQLPLLRGSEVQPKGRKKKELPLDAHAEQYLCLSGSENVNLKCVRLLYIKPGALNNETHISNFDPIKSGATRLGSFASSATHPTNHHKGARGTFGAQTSLNVASCRSSTRFVWRKILTHPPSWSPGVSIPARDAITGKQ